MFAQSANKQYCIRLPIQMSNASFVFFTFKTMISYVPSRMEYKEFAIVNIAILSLLLFYGIRWNGYGVDKAKQNQVIRRVWSSFPIIIYSRGFVNIWVTAHNYIAKGRNLPSRPSVSPNFHWLSSIRIFLLFHDHCRRWFHYDLYLLYAIVWLSKWRSEMNGLILK